MPRLQARSFATATDVRTFPNGRADVVRLDESTVGYGVYQPAGAGLDLPIRVGVHTGEVEFVGEDARGLAVHTAARVMALGGADDVTVSSTTRDLLEGSDLALEAAGEHELKGLPGVRRVFRLATN